MNIYLVRHTKVALSRDYCYGISDVELAESQQEDIQRVKEKLNDIHFQGAFMSPLKRCRLLGDELSEKSIPKDDLLEMDFGDWELKRWDELNQEIVDAWMNDFVNERPPNGESYMDFSMKSVFFFDRLAKEFNEEDNILLTSHSGVIRAIICHVLNLSLAHSFNFEVDFGSVSKIEVIDGWYKVRYLNH
jgi:alpha-ribazole phosphatase